MYLCAGVIPNTGHFHVMVDAPAPAEGEAIPFDAAHLHYGKGQTSADIELAPVSHTGIMTAGMVCEVQDSP